MPFRISESFQVQAPVEQVWRYLVDPRQVVQCLPGAELTEVQDAKTFLGKVKVTVGPVTAGYSGRALLTEANESVHLVRILGEGRESGGAGSAKMTMSSRVVALPDGGSEVRVDLDIDVTGKIMQFGRGMIDGVTRQLVRQFAECTHARLETPTETQAARAGVASVASAPPAAASPPPAAASTGSIVTAQVAADATRVDSSRAGGAPAAPMASAHGAQPIRVLPVTLRAIWSTVTGLFSKRAKP